MNATKFNQIGDVLQHPKLGLGEWVVTQAGGETCDVVLRPLKVDQDRIDWSRRELRFSQDGNFDEKEMLRYTPPIRRINLEKRNNPTQGSRVA